MIQRFCFVKLHDAHVADRTELAARLRGWFEEAGAAATVGLPADASAVRWDLSIVIGAASLEAWQALAAAPKVMEIFDHIASRAKVQKEWTFDVGVE